MLLINMYSRNALRFLCFTSEKGRLLLLIPDHLLGQVYNVFMESVNYFIIVRIVLAHDKTCIVVNRLKPQ